MTTTSIAYLMTRSPVHGGLDAAPAPAQLRAVAGAVALYHTPQADILSWADEDTYFSYIESSEDAPEPAVPLARREWP